MATKTRWLLTLALLASCTEAEDEDQDGAGAGAGGEAGDPAGGEGSGLAACTPERSTAVVAENQRFAGDYPIKDECAATFESLDGLRIAIAERERTYGTATRVEVEFDHGTLLSVDGVPCERITPEGLAGSGGDCDQRYVCGCCPFDLLYDKLATEGWAVNHTMAWCGGHEAGYGGRTEASPVYQGTKFYGGSQEEIPERPSGSSEACRRCTSACRGIPGCSCCSKCGSCLAN